MILDKYLNVEEKKMISIISSMIWIYFRTEDCYKLIPRKSISSVILVSLWVFLYLQDPLFLPIGLFILYLYGKYF